MKIWVSKRIMTKSDWNVLSILELISLPWCERERMQQRASERERREKGGGESLIFDDSYTKSFLWKLVLKENN